MEHIPEIFFWVENPFIVIHFILGPLAKVGNFVVHIVFSVMPCE